VGDALEEVSKGLMLASLSVTDNKGNTMKEVGKTDPWHVEALKVATGSEKRAYNPLIQTLYEDMDGLEMDCLIELSDAQGYIAHNDEMIVLSFSSTTSPFDWMTNFSTANSSWGSFFQWKTRPLVNREFYNTFLGAAPSIEEHIHPLLSNDERPRKLFVVGHSLGAGIATLAACYFITEYDWSTLPHSLVVVTGGSPRACLQSMKDTIDGRMEKFGDKVRMYRVVKGNDAIATLPPTPWGFRHLTNPIKITEGGQVVMGTEEDDVDVDLMILMTSQGGKGLVEKYDFDDGRDFKNKYDLLLKGVPKHLRDHLPDIYLKALKNAQEHESRSPTKSDQSDSDVSTAAETDSAGSSQSQKKPDRVWLPRKFRNEIPKKIHLNTGSCW